MRSSVTEGLTYQRPCVGLGAKTISPGLIISNYLFWLFCYFSLALFGFVLCEFQLLSDLSFLSSFLHFFIFPSSHLPVQKIPLSVIKKEATVVC